MQGNSCRFLETWEFFVSGDKEAKNIPLSLLPGLLNQDLPAPSLPRFPRPPVSQELKSPSEEFHAAFDFIGLDPTDEDPDFCPPHLYAYKQQYIKICRPRSPGPATMARLQEYSISLTNVDQTVVRPQRLPRTNVSNSTLFSSSCSDSSII